MFYKLRYQGRLAAGWGGGCAHNFCSYELKIYYYADDCDKLCTADMLTCQPRMEDYYGKKEVAIPKWQIKFQWMPMVLLWA